METVQRRTFLQAGGISAFLFGLDPLKFIAGQSLTDPYPGFPAQDLKSVREIVGAAHSDYQRVNELVSARPALAKASWDWGFGDWESALGAASHMGRADIAELLISHGARPNLFTHCIQGHVEAVKSIITSSPGIQSILGPHGITLMSHVKMRLRQSDLSDSQRMACEEIENFLADVGESDVNQPAESMTEAEHKPYLGAYAYGDTEEEQFIVETNRRGLLSIRKGSNFGRVLNKVEAHGFEPSGGPGVRIRFTMKNDSATSLTIHDPTPIILANRI